MYVFVLFSGETTPMSEFYVDSPEIESSTKTLRPNCGRDVVDGRDRRIFLHSVWLIGSKNWFLFY